MIGAELLCRTLNRFGVKFFCGIPGTDNIDVYDVCANYGIRPIVVKNEMFAPMIADGYSRVSRKPGVVLSIPGPGALAMIPGLLEAYASSVPMFAIITDIPQSYLGKGKGYLHEVEDIDACFASVTGEQTIVLHADDISKIFVAACNKMKRERPRPILIRLPADIYKENVSEPAIKEGAFDLREEQSPPSNTEALLAEIEKSERPVIFAGAGVWWSGGEKALLEFAAKMNAPVFTSIGGKGLVSDATNYGFGQLAGEPEMQELILASDCVIALGTRWSDRSTGRWSLKLPQNLIEINISDEDISRNYPAIHVGIGDAGMFLAAALARGNSEERGRDKWLYKFQHRRELIRRRLAHHPEMQIVNCLRAALPSDAIVVNDSAIITYWTRRYFEANEAGTFLWPMGSGTIGWAVPAAIGARLAVDDSGLNSPVVALTGDGGLQFSLQELGTLAQEGLPITIVLFDDSAYGVIRNFQQKRYGKTTSAVFLENPDFKELSQAYGINYTAVENTAELAASLQSAIAGNKPALIHWRVSLAPPERL